MEATRGGVFPHKAGQVLAAEIETGSRLISGRFSSISFSLLVHQGSHRNVGSEYGIQREGIDVTTMRASRICLGSFQRMGAKRVGGRQLGMETIERKSISRFS